ncbi:outer membrane beta-barrel protein [Crocinitomicaceae bacterium CZZ-1]|uniref:Outer membrane beta-barrel protein n=1 Tax=Taishania pollutisoli TaxID=2766479 RepID=A0A8J6U093_9FLAO|nr:outer membrane beta-barrel protein [Taishania pollutisoli]MBC9813103.1 outer membrane beta-barrel protein [Taishania pollutisoli]MBX2950383.1 outer membrane beta-barrel protein [Crocinitomicaceae bacterium]NGF76343.1 porin family protein [Fluviicola sp. SGL-29]
MRKIVLLAAVLFTGFGVKAQGFYGEFNVGYGFGIPSSNLGTESYTDLSGNGSYQKPIYGTLGSGLNLTLTPGYMINKHLGVELGINYFLGSKTVISESSSSVNATDKTTAHSNQLRLLPSLVVSTGGDKLYAYAKAGLAIPVFGDTKGLREISVPSPMGPIPTEVETTTKGNVSLGFRGSVGIGYNISELIGLQLEVFHTSLTIKPKSRAIDSYTVAGQDISGMLTVYDKETKYIDELNSTSNNSSTNPNYSAGVAKEELATKSNFSQFGVSLGVKFNF